MAYGIQIKNANNQITMDTSTRVSNLIMSGTVNVNSGSSQPGGPGTFYVGFSAYQNFPGATNTGGTWNDAEFGLWIAGQTSQTGAGANTFEHIYIEFRYQGANNVSQFRIRYETYHQNKAMTYKYIGFRF